MASVPIVHAITIKEYRIKSEKSVRKTIAAPLAYNTMYIKIIKGLISNP